MHARYAHLALRIGAAFALLYPPYAALADPVSWLSYFPPLLLDAVAGNEMYLLHAFGALEVVLALWILSGWRIQAPSALATLLLLAIVAVNYPQIDVLFRDLSIAALTLALALWPTSESPPRPPSPLASLGGQG